MVVTRTLSVRSREQLELIDITGEISREIADSGITNGIATVFCPGSTGAITTVEYEPGLRTDFKEFFRNLIPYNKNWKHHETWGDDNGSSHLQSAILKTSFTVPIVDKHLTLGTWQQIVFCECDTRPRTRQLILQIIGE